MKLNLLPTYVSKGKQAVAAWVVFALLILVSIVATLGMMTESSRQLQAAKDMVDKRTTAADNAAKLSNLADDVLANAQGVILNSMLAQAMLKHNSAYPDFYDKVMPYIPSFFRVTSMSASPLDAENSALTLTGVIQTQEQYRDLMLALNRIPGVRTVARTGYEIVEQYVPPLVEIDQNGRPIGRNEARIPDDPLARLDFFLAKGGTSTFSGVGGFGSGEPGTKGAMPNWSVVTVTAVVAGNLQTPNPRATLGGGAAPASSAGGRGGGGSPMIPGAPAGASGGAGRSGPAATGPGGKPPAPGAVSPSGGGGGSTTAPTAAQ